MILLKNIITTSIILTAIASCTLFSNKKTAGLFPVYGNWCGPQHPKDGTNPTPIDRTDMACKNHDICYDKNGFLNKKCDNSLIMELKSFVPRDNIESNARKLIISYFKKSLKL